LAECCGRPGDLSRFDTEPLWWPPAKNAGRLLAPVLAELTGEDVTEPSPGIGSGPAA
jgi:hypothetical protein